METRGLWEKQCPWTASQPAQTPQPPPHRGPGKHPGHETTGLTSEAAVSSDADVFSELAPHVHDFILKEEPKSTGEKSTVAGIPLAASSDPNRNHNNFWRWATGEMNRHQRFVEGQERKGRYTNTKEKERTAKASVSREFPPTTNFTKHSEVVFGYEKRKTSQKWHIIH